MLVSPVEELEKIELEIAVEVDDVEMIDGLLLLDDVTVLSIYILRRFGPPHISIELPTQAILHPLDAGTDPVLITLPQ